MVILIVHTTKIVFAVRATGKAPLHKGQPGYSSHLDRDGDGIACENSNKKKLLLSFFLLT